MINTSIYSRFLVFTLITFCLHTFSTNLNASVSCFQTAAVNKKSLKHESLKQIQEFSKLITDDAKLREELQDPLVSQYLYLNFFTEGVTAREISYVLQMISDSKTTGPKDLYSILSKLDIKNSSKAAVQQNKLEFEKQFRTGKFRLWLNSLSKNFKHLVKSFLSIRSTKKMIEEGMSVEVFDRGLFDFYGATQLGLPESQLRPWDRIPGGLAAVRPGQVKNLNPSTWSEIAFFASETEAPINDYSTNSGEILRALMPSLSAFMGKTHEQYLAHQEKAKKEEKDIGQFCKNVWCKEESRHENAIMRLAEQVTGMEKTEPTTFAADPRQAYDNIDNALMHVIGRNSSEWNANSIYFYLRAHSRGETNQWVDNVRQDETKHMAVFAGAYKYFYGNNVLFRLKGMIDKIRKLKSEASTSNSNGSVLNGHPFILFELGMIHYYVEKQVQQYIKSLPLKTLEKIFESEVKTIEDQESLEVDAQKKLKIEAIADREKQNRLNLLRWKTAEAKKYQALKEFENKYGAMIEGLISGHLKYFEGAEVYKSPRSLEVTQKIDSIKMGLSSSEEKLLKLSLKETLRDYQIMNNSHVRSRKDLVVEFKNIHEGFIVRERHDHETKVLEISQETEHSLSFKVKKPLEIDNNLQAGAAFEISIDTKNGRESRYLSLANNPKDTSLEFAVGLSDSNFKQALVDLKTNFDRKIYVKELSGMGLNFQFERPMVFIAGGIGITPFRSAIQYAKYNKIGKEIYLVYANRKEASFLKDLEKDAHEMGNFSVTHTISQAELGKKIILDRKLQSPLEVDFSNSVNLVGDRVNATLIAELKRQVPKDAIYYIVGSPNFVKGIESQLLGQNIAKENIQLELFAAPTNTSNFGASSQTSKGSTKSETVCFCHGVSCGGIQDIVKKGGSLEDVISETMATTGCGRCKDKVASILKMEEE